ncbi:MAG: phosphoribosylanthranilate isomerase [Pseudomonadota bacterium]
MPDAARVAVKICGLRTADTVAAAVTAGADYLGFTFVTGSPREVSVADAAALSADVPAGVVKVGLVVDPSDAFLRALTQAVPLDMLQLHGEEPPARVRDVRARFGLPVMKAVGVADAADLDTAAEAAQAADRLLLDARPPAGSDLPGGNGLSFDWRILTGRAWPVPWMLAGGLTPDTVAEALRVSRAPGVDVSSGVERARGVKDPDLIRAFVAAARAPVEPAAI